MISFPAMDPTTSAPISPTSTWPRYGNDGYDGEGKEGTEEGLNRDRLHEVVFILETGANTLVHQLNGSGTGLPGVLMTRWFAWIRLFDFEMRHVPKMRHRSPERNLTTLTTSTGRVSTILSKPS